MQICISTKNIFFKVRLKYVPKMLVSLQWRDSRSGLVWEPRRELFIIIILTSFRSRPENGLVNLGVNFQAVNYFVWAFLSSAENHKSGGIQANSQKRTATVLKLVSAPLLYLSPPPFRVACSSCLNDSSFSLPNSKNKPQMQIKINC